MKATKLLFHPPLEDFSPLIQKASSFLILALESPGFKTLDGTLGSLKEYRL